MLTFALAFAAPDFTELKEWGDCTLYKRAKTEALPSGMKAECHWPDVDPRVLGKMLHDVDRYDEWVWPIDVSETRRVDGDRKLVYQLQKIWAISDREVLLWVQSENLEDGGVRASWHTASEEFLPERKGVVRTPYNVGFWEVHPDSEGTGSVVVHEIAVDAGGLPLPGWLLRAIQARGFGKLMDELREAAKPQP